MVVQSHLSCALFTGSLHGLGAVMNLMKVKIIYGDTWSMESGLEFL